MYLGQRIEGEKHFVVKTRHNEVLVSGGVARRAVEAGFAVFDSQKREFLGFYRRITLSDFLDTLECISECLNEEMLTPEQKSELAQGLVTIALESWDWVHCFRKDVEADVTFALTELQSALERKTPEAARIVDNIIEKLK